MKNLSGTLRIASAMCFIGHGAFGIITKSIWCNYFAIAGIGHDLAYRLMPVVGTVDLLMGFSLLLYPTPAITAWLVCWGLITASMRPLSGEPFAEMIERAGNYGAPLALLLLSATGVPTGKGRVWSRLDVNPQPDPRHYGQVLFCLRITVFLLLLGHGWLNLLEKKALLQQYLSLGFSHAAETARMAGTFELLAAVAVLVGPVRPLLFIFFVWKMGTELLYPHWELFEWIERGGSYGCILALWIALGKAPVRTIHPKTTLSF